MKPKEYDWLSSYLQKLQLEVLTVGYNQVKPQWKNWNVAPPFCCLYFIEGGEGWFKIKGRETHPGPGEIVLLPAGVIHSYSTSPEKPYLKYWCHFQAKVGEMHLFHLLDMPSCFPLGDATLFKNRFRDLLNAYRSSHPLAPLQAKSALTDIVTMLFDECLPDQVQPASNPSLDKHNEIIRYIEDHLSEELTVEQLARIVNYSPNYFIQFFKTMQGLSPIQYINNSRIAKAKRLLLTTDMSQAQIASELGMEPHYFSRMFKRHEQFSPQHYRNMMREKE
ncbi:AraC family transcriptional regulator [Paenibacillus sp. RC67]|uniref:helix-turn-helix domain-containing protein n=1 Tax=Paenibacillus sp. RC67 TaxID=3039392 RepID=UPI0024AE7B27|nr:AraC family transcriptional regulator [Paenibacillus sp. RC67]